MVYMGSKGRLAKHIAPIINEAVKKSNGMLFEPFCGGCNITPHFAGRVFANDLNEGLISLFKEAISGRKFPEYVDIEMHRAAKNGEYDKALTAYIGFCASYNGRYFSGFVGNGYHTVNGYHTARRKRDYQKENIRSFNKTVASLKAMPSLTLSSRPYTDLEIPENSVIYCDPPYEGTSQYKIGGFDHDRFWQWAEVMSESNTVFVSEYSTRSDLFVPIWSKDIPSPIGGTSKRATEKLYISLIN